MIETADPTGKPNGFLLPIWNALEDAWRPDQVYVTAVYPECRKGPHLHLHREGRFFCLVGAVEIVTRDGSGRYHKEFTDQDDERVIWVPPGIPAAIYNVGPVTAKVLNMPSPAWSADFPDDHPVEDWEYP